MQQKLDSQRVKLKDLKGMAIAIVAALAMPVAVWSMREGPLQADTAPQLAQLAFERTKFDVANEVLWNVDAYGTKQKQIDARWQELKDELNESDKPAAAMEAITETAKAHLKEKQWPVLITQGWVKSEPVWVLASAWRAPAGGGGNMCGGPSLKGMYNARHRGVEAHTRILVFESKAPYRLLSG